MADGLDAFGIPHMSASKFAAQTIVGAAKMVFDTGRHPAILRDEVSSSWDFF